jgi:hypothetical protein
MRLPVGDGALVRGVPCLVLSGMTCLVYEPDAFFEIMRWEDSR